MDWLLRCLADVLFYMFIFIQGVCNRSQLQVVLECFSFGSALLTVLILTRCWCGCSCWAWWIAVVVQSWCKFCVTRSGVRSAARCEGLTVIVIVIVINVLFAAHTHVSMARPSLAHSLVVYPRPVTCRCGVSGDTYHAPAFSTRQSPVSTLVYSPQGAHWHPAASVGCRWFWRAPGLY